MAVILQRRSRRLVEMIQVNHWFHQLRWSIHIIMNYILTIWLNYRRRSREIVIINSVTSRTAIRLWRRRTRVVNARRLDTMRHAWITENTRALHKTTNHTVLTFTTTCLFPKSLVYPNLRAFVIGLVLIHPRFWVLIIRSARFWWTDPITEIAAVEIRRTWNHNRWHLGWQWRRYIAASTWRSLLLSRPAETFIQMDVGFGRVLFSEHRAWVHLEICLGRFEIGRRWHVSVFFVVACAKSKLGLIDYCIIRSIDWGG